MLQSIKGNQEEVDKVSKIQSAFKAKRERQAMAAEKKAKEADAKVETTVEEKIVEVVVGEVVVEEEAVEVVVEQNDYRHMQTTQTIKDDAAFGYADLIQDSLRMANDVGSLQNIKQIPTE